MEAVTAAPRPAPPRLPAVTGLPLIGSAPDLATPKLRDFLTRNYLARGPVFRASALGQPLTVLAGPEATLFVAKEGHRVLRSLEAWRPNDRAFGTERSLVSADGELHRRYRKVEGRAYSRSYFAARLPGALAVAAEELRPYAPGGGFPVAEWCKRTVTEQLAQMVVGGSTRGHLPDLLHFVQTTLMVKVTGQLPSPALRLPAYRRARTRIFGMLGDLIAEHRAHPAGEGGRDPDLIDDVLAAQREDPAFWGEADVRFAALGAFIAGMDTAANTLAFFLYRALRHPELLPALQAEADALFEHGPPSAEALGQAPHLHRFVMETLRVHPIAPALDRTLTQDVEFGGHTLRAGTRVLIGTTVAHGLERFYRDPERFDPERFSPERAEHRQPGAYAPFGAGTHTCAGSALAEGLIMLNAAAVLRTLDLELPQGYVLRQVARPTPSPDHRLVLRVRRVRHEPQTLLG